MLKLSREEFEEKIRNLIDQKTTRKELIKELKTDSRTLNNKIKEISGYNSDLYYEYITKFPYRTKERNDLDYEALIIEIIQTGMTSEEASKKYNIGGRTIQRRVNELEKENTYLVDIYKQVKECNKKSSKPDKFLQEKIDNLVTRPVILCPINGIRKSELEEVEKEYNKRCLTMSKEQAARSMGMTKPQIYKMLNELDRLRTEDSVQNFKESLKVKTTQMETKCINTKPEEDKQKINEGEEK